MDDLIAWLHEQINHDEQLAKWAAEEVGDGRWRQRNVRIVTVADRDREVADYAITECIDHIIQWDPARVLADCEAKRRIISKAQLGLAEVDEMPYNGAAWLAEEVLMQLAEPYARLGRPGYQESWRS